MPSARSCPPVLVLCAVACLFSFNSASAQNSYEILLNFQNSWGVNPAAPPIFDHAGNLYVTSTGATAIELAPLKAETWTPQFLSKIPESSFGSMVFDGSGNLYGTTSYGGVPGCGDLGVGCGTVFELIHNADGSWSESTLYNFQGGADGGFPYASLVMDWHGNLFGTTSEGGLDCVLLSGGCGVVFELTPNGDGTWTEQTIYSFGSRKNDGYRPFAGLTLHNGILYGTTAATASDACLNKPYACGTVFSLHKNKQGAWVETTLHFFQGGAEGRYPQTGVVFDGHGNLYGATVEGGKGCVQTGGCGVVYMLTPETGGAWAGKAIYRFLGGIDGAEPSYGKLVLGANGDLFGTTTRGGNNSDCLIDDCGTVFKLSPNAEGIWQETVLHRFGDFGNDGYNPLGGVVLRSGHLFGTAYMGGSGGGGIVFELAP